MTALRTHRSRGGERATSRRHAAALDPRASADLLIDRDRLTDVLGREVRASRLRFKPGLSTTAALQGLGGENSLPGWIQVSHPAHHDKLHNAVRRARERGEQVHVLQVDGLTVAHGAIDTDPRLQRGLDALRTAHPSISEALASERLRVLRYNPHRRLVLRRDVSQCEPLVLRVTAQKQVGVRAALRQIAAAGVPVVEPIRTHGRRPTRRVTVWPWFGRGDLSELGEDTAAHAAGTALALLHGSDISSPDTPDAVDGLLGLAADLADLDGGAATRLTDLAGQVAGRITAGEWATGPVHGDFSADQVLVGGVGQETVRLTDFDRQGRGPLLADLGSFAAAELLARAAGGGDTPDPESLPLTRALQAGYAEAQVAGSAPVSAVGLRNWTARSLLTRVAEPFRAADPDWIQGINRRLDQVEEMLS